MSLPLQNFRTLVRTQAVAVQHSCGQLTDLTVGSVLRALLEANASVGLWIQWLIVQVLATTRASTSTGNDLDSWMADFSIGRLAATPAMGYVTFSRATAGLATTIAPGVLVRTGLNANDPVFAVVADTSNAAWIGSSYSVAATDLSISLPVRAQSLGSMSNVLAGSITTLATAVPGIDSVNNPLALSGGADAETDAALRARFRGFLDSRTRATDQAVGFAIASVRQDLVYTIVDRVDASGATRAGHFTITIDDGSGAPSGALIALVADAVDAVRPLGSTFTIRPPVVLPTSVQIKIVGPPQAAANVRSALNAYVNSLSIGMPLTLTRLYQVGYDADESVSNVMDAQINGLSEDVTPPVFGVLRATNIVVLS